jgi:hypothetical protein
MIVNDFIPYIILITFLVTAGVVYYYIGANVAGNDNAKSAISTLNNVVGIDAGLFIAFCIFNVFLLKAHNGKFNDLYQVIMIHGSFLLSFIAVTITLLSKTT